ncbi:MAG: thioredoxin [Desulfovibrionaceae bacterium]
MTIEITDMTFEQEVLQSTSPVLVDFWAPWCAPCRALAPIIDSLAIEYKDNVKIVKIDIDENPDVATKYGVRSIPTLILFDKGQMVDQMASGTKDAIKQLISKAQ